LLVIITLDGLPIEGETERKLAVLESGHYQVIVFASGCSSISNPQHVMVTDIDQPLSAIQVYPIPAKRVLNMKLPDPDAPVSFRLLNATGQQVAAETIRTREGYLFMIDQLSAGLYLLQVEDLSGRRYVFRVLVD
jgi:hypothetical protein